MLSSRKIVDWSHFDIFICERWWPCTQILSVIPLSMRHLSVFSSVRIGDDFVRDSCVHTSCVREFCVLDCVVCGHFVRCRAISVPRFVLDEDVATARAGGRHESVQ